ncbi:MAG: tripartite tricarboxylate transporter substrate binding protein [Betaproteobacteria bacterium]|nr:tripartite tricarboxylate transporter substrate binding protein [Betaproteobacteria bacterium]
MQLRRFAVWTAVTLIAAGFTSSGLAQSYPSKPVRGIVSFAAGGQNDFVARVVGQKLSERWGQQVVIENRPGANGNMGTEAVVNAAPDGYTIYFALQTLAGNAVVAPTPAFDPRKDLAPVTLIGFAEAVIVVNPTIPVKTVLDLVRHAKENSGKLYYGATTVGSAGQIGMEVLKSITGLPIEMVPYKNIGNLIADIVAGRVSVYFTPVTPVLPLIQSGKLRAIGVTGAKRLSMLPDVPTIRESGLTTFEVTSWYGLFTPIRTPRDIQAKLNADMRWALDQADVRTRLTEGGIEPKASTPEELRTVVDRDIQQLEELVRRGAIKPI